MKWSKREAKHRLWRKHGRGSRLLSGILAFLLTLMAALPCLPAGMFPVSAAEPGDTILAYSEGFHHYCIDGYGANRALIKGDEYQYILPSQSLSDRERAIAFWAMLSLQAGFGNIPAVNTVVHNINQQAASRGLAPISPCVTEEDLRKIIHQDTVLAKYGWIQKVLANEDVYLQMAGLVGAEGTGGPARPVPAVLQGHTSLSGPLAVDKSTLVIPFDPGGGDAGFLAKVPLLFSATGAEGSFTPQPTGGWTYQKMDDRIVFHNASPDPPSMLIQFNTVGTEYQSQGSYASAEEVYERCLQLWVCVRCSGDHAMAHVGYAPLEEHQRLVFVELEAAPAQNYYAVLGGGLAAASGAGSMEFEVYRHEEDFTSTYNLQMYKYDHETGKPLEDAVFNLYERFDDKEEINRTRDGAVQLYEGGSPYQSYHKDNPVIWDSFRFVSSLFTDENGHAEKTVNHGYHYDKTFCDGHPSPVFVAVPEEEEDPETGEIENEAEIEAAQNANKLLARRWLDCCADCQDHADGEFSGVHFHWVMPSVDTGRIYELSSSGGSPGETPSAGTTSSADGERSFAASGCQEDQEDTYERFISLRYSYALVEETARPGYINHGIHADDLPVEVITTDASEHGANAVFAGIYGNQIAVNENRVVLPASEVRRRRAEAAAFRLEGGNTPEGRNTLEGGKMSEDSSVTEGGKTPEKELPGESPGELQEERAGTARILQGILRFFLPQTQSGGEETGKATPADADADYDEEAASDEIQLVDDRTDTATSSNLEERLQQPEETASASNAALGAGLTFSAGRKTKGEGERTEQFASLLSERSAGGVFSNAYNLALSAAGSGREVSPGPKGNYSHCKNADHEGDAWRIYDHRTEGELHINKRDLELQEGGQAGYDSYGDAQGDATLEGAVYGLFAAADIVHPDGKTGVVYRANNLVATAVTDVDGNASFLVNTEAPGYRYDYNRGSVVETGDGWAKTAPSSLYTFHGRVDDYTGDEAHEREYYDYESENSNSWIGRPLFMGDYYIRELSRSEGYELSVGNREALWTNLGQELEVTAEATGQGRGYANITRGLFAEAQISDPADYHELYFEVESRETGQKGFDLWFTRLPEGTKLYRLDASEQEVPVQTGTGRYEEAGVTDEHGNPVYVTAEHDYQYPRYNPDGSFMTKPEAVQTAVKQIPVVTGSPLEEEKTQECLLSGEENLTAAQVAEKLMEVFSPEETEFVRRKLEKALLANRRAIPENGDCPVVTLQIAREENGTLLTTGDLLATILDFYNTSCFYTCGGLCRLEETGEGLLVTVYAGRKGNPENFYVPDENDVTRGRVYHLAGKVYAVYTPEFQEQAFGRYEDEVVEEIGGTFFFSGILTPDAVADADGGLVQKTREVNLYYQTGETPCDAMGNPIQKMEYREVMAEGTQLALVEQYVEVPLSPWGETLLGTGLTAHIDGSYTDSYGMEKEDGAGAGFRFKLTLPQQFVTLTREDVDTGTNQGGWKEGDVVGAAAYYLQIQQARVMAFLDLEHRSIGGSNSYVKMAVLSYPGQYEVWQDGDGRPGTSTRVQPVGVQERVITQQIKVTKTIEEEPPLDNFRFKTYLKSNLQRLYRNEAGEVFWQDQKGRERDVLAHKAVFPARTEKIFTKVRHRTAPLYQDSADAVIANAMLYSYEDGLIGQQQNPGYTAVLEMAEQTHGVAGDLEPEGDFEPVPNYRKFFDALAVANHDKWDDAAPTYTSWRPMGNAADPETANRSQDTIANARVSDQVRQFAIDWYLEDEVKKLVKKATGAPLQFSSALYDEALHQAVLKAENYLKPFFFYDLDEIYAVAWDSAGNGGGDRDPSTLSADFYQETGGKDGAGAFCGISARLPYGIYVVVEQQPRYAALGDLANRHYERDVEREVVVPSAYEDYAGAQAFPEVTDRYFHYDAGLSWEEMERRYHIRFHQESQIVYAHSHSGDFEVYPYGQDIDRITSKIPAEPGKGDYFALSQSEYRPYQNHYNDSGIRSDQENPYYLTEGKSGRKAVSSCYYYSSLSEHEKDEGVMHGVLTAKDGQYAPMLIPYAMTAPSAPEMEAEEMMQKTGEERSYVGYGYTKMENRLFKARLRLEKLDAETHENILHDSAMFQIYKAVREEDAGGEGRVLFYEEDTVLPGSRMFLEAMGARQITPLKRQRSWLERIGAFFAGEEANIQTGMLYSGVVSAGTPVCREEDLLVQEGADGKQTAVFQTCTTVSQAAGEEESLQNGPQTVGYLETPQPLSAGVYVLCEVKPPAGYVRSRPVALEVYSDQVTYYQEGNKDSRVVAAVYDYVAGEQGQESRTEGIHAAHVYVEDTPVRLQVEKKKESGGEAKGEDQTITYKVSGRVEGRLVEIGNDPSLEYAYLNGDYQGYGWKKGTREYLQARREAGEQVELVYQGGLFAGYGYVTRRLETADDENPYVAGALMTLFDGVKLRASMDTQDHAYEGLVIERDGANNVNRMYVQKGYAGEKTEFTEENGILVAGVTERPDTDILYYDLDSLLVTGTQVWDGREIRYGYDRNFNQVDLNQIEEDRQKDGQTNREQSIFAFKGGTPYLEFAGGDFTKITYSARDKVLQVGEDTRVYHLDRDGQRDALVDPYTGMAYVEWNAPALQGQRMAEPDSVKRKEVLVWPVQIHRDAHGNIIARDKITTWRPATVGENKDGYQEHTVLEVTNHSGHEIAEEDRPSWQHAESGYLTGSWHSDEGEESHHETSLQTTPAGQNRNNEVLTDDNTGVFEKELNPVCDEYGLPVYYRKSSETYDKSTDLYDRNDDFVRQQDSDNLKAYNNAAFSMQESSQLYDGDADVEKQRREPLFHRQGEGYILENTWKTSDKTPNDPFWNQQTDGQPDVIKRLLVGTYIMEELQAPDGYLRGMPQAVVVGETADLQQAEMTDQTIKVEVSKIDGEPHSEKSAYGYGMVSGAGIALYEAKRIYTRDGYELVKTNDQPLVFDTTDSRWGSPRQMRASWITDEKPVYLEGIPQGLYLLEEYQTPSGFVTAEPVEVEVKASPEVQRFVMYDDHTKLEVEKYYQDGTEQIPLPGAGFTLYEEGDPGTVLDAWTTIDMTEYRGFIPVFEEMYRLYGTMPDTVIRWEANGIEHTARLAEVTRLDGTGDGTGLEGGSSTGFPTSAVLLFCTDTGMEIRVSAYGEYASQSGRAFTFEYQFDYRKLPHINAHACAWTTQNGCRRVDYLPAGLRCRLVETTVPEGFSRAEDLHIEVKNDGAVQRWRVENVEGTLMVSKTAAGRPGELPGARLGLYRPEADGSFQQTEANLLLDWVTGQDGVYTEEDAVNNRIPEGYQRGDRKPHTIRRLPDGIYWIAELASPAYYTTFEPVRIEYHQEEELRIVRVCDTPVTGSLHVEKTDESGRRLEGAVFELSAYRMDHQHQPLFVRLLSVQQGEIRVQDLPVGEIQEDGRIEPWLYKLKELMPPEGYAVSTEVIRWQFAPDNQGVSFGYGETARHQIRVPNKKSRIVITKKAFSVWEKEEAAKTAAAVSGDDSFVPGAKLAVYQVNGRDEQDQVIYDEEMPVEVWTTRAEEPGHVIEGLTAGRTYLLKELEAPEGYHVMNPVLFTLSADGRKIASVTDRLNTVTVHYEKGEAGEPDPDTIAAVTVRGRYVAKVMHQITDGDGALLAGWSSLPDRSGSWWEEGGEWLQKSQENSAAYYDLQKTDQMQDGQICTILERTMYSDGTSQVTAKMTRPLYFNEDGVCRIAVRTAAEVELTMEEESGRQIVAFTPTEWIQEKTVSNLRENPLFSCGGTYLIRETTRYTDGAIRESNRLSFTLDGQGGIHQLTGYDQKTSVELSKVEITGGEELPGCQMQVMNLEGTILDTWISGNVPHRIEGRLEEGKTYVLTELQAADGYVRAGEIPFTVTRDGVTERVVMVDDTTKVEIAKLDKNRGQPLAGAWFQILDEEGRVWASWISKTEPHRLEAVLRAGGSYRLHEKQAPAGYQQAEDILFAVPEDGSLVSLICENVRTPDSSGPDEPKRPQIRRIGRITALYQPEVPRIPWLSSWLYQEPDGSVHIRLPRTGDGGRGSALALVFLGSLAGAGLLKKRRR